MDNRTFGELITPSKILIMKVGFHGNEDLTSIIARKKMEEEAIGHTYWGYGGTLCHPKRVVQACAEEQQDENSIINVVFTVTKSPFFGNSEATTQFSVDALDWQPLPTDARVTASKYALILRNLEPCTAVLPVSDYRVACGPSAGRPLDEYFRYRVDKAIGQIVPQADRNGIGFVPIAFRAELVAPYAVFVR